MTIADTPSRRESDDGVSNDNIDPGRDAPQCKLLELISMHGRKTVKWEGETFGDFVQLCVQALQKELQHEKERMERRDERFLGASIDTEWEGMAGRVHTSSRRVYAIFQRAVCLHHPVYGVAYEGFELGDLVQGSKVHVSLRVLLQAIEERYKMDITNSNECARTSARDHSWHGTTSDPNKAGSEDLPDEDQDAYEKGNDWIQRARAEVWGTLDNPRKSKLALGLTCASMSLIVYSTSTFCVETLHAFYEPRPSNVGWLYLSEAFCISFFTLEAVARILTCPDLKKYFNDTLNLIDLVAILPFYMTLALQNTEIPGLEVLRVVRLVRVLRLFKVSRSSVAVFTVTMRESLRPLWMLAMLTMMAIVLFASITFFLERGERNVKFDVWERVIGYECETTVNAKPAEIEGSSRYSWCYVTDPQPEELEGNKTLLECPYNYKRDHKCRKVWAQSPFESIPGTMPFIFETMVTVGYGSDIPETSRGFVIGAVVVLFGMLVIALPVSVVGSNFAVVYRELNQETSDRPLSGDGRFDRTGEQSMRSMRSHNGANTILI